MQLQFFVCVLSYTHPPFLFYQNRTCLFLIYFFPCSRLSRSTRSVKNFHALHSFFRKLAQGIGPSLGLVLATKLGYDASLKAAQTIEVATRMRYLVPIMYLGSYIMMIIAYGVVFNLDKKTLAQMESDLKERRAKNEK